MEDFEFINFQPAKDLIKKGLRRAGSPVRKGFGAGKRIAGKATSGLMGGSKLRKIHHGAIRESVAPSAMIKNRYESMGNFYIGDAGGKFAKKKISGVSSRNVAKANLVSQRGRGTGQTTTARRAASGPMYIKGSILPKAFNSIEATIHLDEMLDEQIELVSKTKLWRRMGGQNNPWRAGYAKQFGGNTGKPQKPLKTSSRRGKKTGKFEKRMRDSDVAQHNAKQKVSYAHKRGYSDGVDHSRGRGVKTRGRGLTSDGSRRQDVSPLNEKHRDPDGKLFDFEAKLDEAIELSRKPAKTIKDLSQKKISQIKTGELFKALQKIL
jgi:hypothetical protein